MATQQDLARYVEEVRSRYIDVDGHFGAQCWDQFAHYAAWLGVPVWRTYTNAFGWNPHPGYACNVHHHAWAGLGGYFEVLPATASPRPGDVAFWEHGSAWYPWSHVATVLEVTHGGRMLRCLTQNPGAVQIADLVLNGVIGYLRPRSLTIGPINASRTKTLSASEKQQSEEDDMAKRVGLFYTDTSTKHIVYVIADTSSGFYKTSSARKPGVPMDTPQLQRWAIAYELGGGGFMETTHYEARDLEQACAKVRAGRA